MFERFGESARQVVVPAQDEARTLEHDYIGTEHLLLGLLREPEGLAGRVLASLQIPIETCAPRSSALGLVREDEGIAARILVEFDGDIRAPVLRAMGGDPVAAPSPGVAPLVGMQFPFTTGAQQVLSLAQDEARRLRHNYIGTEHILLGLLREEEGLAARVLASLGVRLGTVRTQVARIVGGGDEVCATSVPTARRFAARSSARSRTPAATRPEVPAACVGGLASATPC